MRYFLQQQQQQQPHSHFHTFTSTVTQVQVGKSVKATEAQAERASGDGQPQQVSEHHVDGTPQAGLHASAQGPGAVREGDAAADQHSHMALHCHRSREHTIPRYVYRNKTIDRSTTTTTNNSTTKQMKTLKVASTTASSSFPKSFPSSRPPST